MLTLKSTPLAREIAAVLIVKIFALAVLKYCFFSNPTSHGLKNNPERVLAYFLDTPLSWDLTPSSTRDIFDDQ
jgi:hypothetical protein